MAQIISPQEHHLNLITDTLRNGGIIIFPTETVYGIGVDYRQISAVERLFRIKSRPFNMPFLLHCADITQVRMAVRELPAIAEKLFNQFLPGPLALILYRSKTVPDIITAGTEKAGIRVVANEFFIRIAKELNVPLAGTSANISGEPATNNFAQISSLIINQCDIAIDAGITGSGKPSTIIDLTSSPPRLIRQGEISRDAIEHAINFELAE